MKMTENFKIISSFIKDMSSETPDVQTFLFVKEKISSYQLNINFLVGGNIINKPKKSVAKPGKIKSNAAKAKAAPEIIS